MLYRFGDHTLDAARGELRRGDQAVHVEPQVYAVLAYLLRHRDRLVTKAELLDEVWGSAFVSDATLTSRVKAARRAVGDDGATQAVIRTVRGRGFRFVAGVQVDGPADDSAGDQDTWERHGGPAAGRRRVALPVPATTLVGRAPDLDELEELLSVTPLVTICGPGGVGKTRCAIEVASRVAAALDLDVEFVDLAPATTRDDVVNLTADAVGVRLDLTTMSVRVLADAVRTDRRLVVLDNAEHVVAPVAELAAALRTASGVKLLVTSRERLRVSGERVHTLAPLEVTGAAGRPSPAARLFVDAARRLAPDFAPDEQGLRDVEALCAAVDGLPLGIELVASQVRLLAPGELRERLTGRLATVAERSRDLPARQRSLREAIEWSFRLLTESERLVLGRLAVFHAPVDLDAVEAVAVAPADDAFAVTGALVDKSLLHRRAGVAGTTRFAMLDLVREEARRLLADSPDPGTTQDRHAAYVHRFVAELEDVRWSERPHTWVRELRERWPDVEAALGHGFEEGDPALAAATVASLSGFWHRDARMAAGAAWTARALEHRTSLEPLQRGLLHHASGYRNFWLRRTHEARRQWEEALGWFEAAGHDRYRALGMVDRAGTWIGAPTGAVAAVEECEQGLALARQVGEGPLVAHALNVLGELARLQGDHDRAREAYAEARDLVRDLGDRSHQAILEVNLAVLDLAAGNVEGATRHAHAGMRLVLETRSQVVQEVALVALGATELAAGRPASAARMLGAADHALEVTGSSRGPGDLPDYLRLREGLRAALLPEQLLREVETGRGLDVATLVRDILLPGTAPGAAPDVRGR